MSSHDYRWPEELEVGDRVILVNMTDDPDPILPGDTGLITRIVHGSLAQLSVNWVSGRTLALVPSDHFAVIPGYTIQELP